MALTTDAPVPSGVIDEIAGTDGFAEGHAIDSLSAYGTQSRSTPTQP